MVVILLLLFLLLIAFVVVVETCCGLKGRSKHGNMNEQGPECLLAHNRVTSCCFSQFFVNSVPVIAVSSGGFCL